MFILEETPFNYAVLLLIFAAIVVLICISVNKIHQKQKMEVLIDDVKSRESSLRFSYKSGVKDHLAKLKAMECFPGVSIQVEETVVKIMVCDPKTKETVYSSAVYIFNRLQEEENVG